MEIKTSSNGGGQTATELGLPKAHRRPAGGVVSRSSAIENEQAERREFVQERSAGSENVQALVDIAAMCAIETQTESKLGLDGLMAPVVKVASVDVAGAGGA